MRALSRSNDHTNPVTRWGRPRALGALALCLPLLGACASFEVPDIVNPVEWYRSSADAVGGWFEDDDDVDRMRTSSSGAAGSDKGSFPKLSSVPAKPADRTSAEQRANIVKGLVTDRKNARHAEEQASKTSSVADNTVIKEILANKGATQVGSAPDPASAATKRLLPSQSRNANQSKLWPNAPAPKSAGDRAATTGRVGDAGANSTVPNAAKTASKVPLMRMTRSSDTTAMAEEKPEETTMPVVPTTAMATSSMATSSMATTVTTTEAPAMPTDTGIITLIPPSDVASDQPATETMSAQPQLQIEQSAAPIGDLSRLLLPSAGDQGNGQTTLRFAHGSSRLSGADKRRIAQLAELLRQTNGTVTIVGHASERTGDMDPVKHDMVNFLISMERANAVAQAFITQGIEVQRIFVEAVGSSAPLVSEIMPRFEAENRRAEIYINS